MTKEKKLEELCKDSVDSGLGHLGLYECKADNCYNRFYFGMKLYCKLIFKYHRDMNAKDSKEKK